jgi:hypothetical protein
MKKNRYRLDEFIITEYDNLLFTWEMHIAIGAQRSGNCFVIGNILILGPWSHEDAGYLKLEFHEQLMKLPVWNRTQYYCFSSDLRDTGTGQRVSDYFVRQQTGKDKIPTVPVKISEPGIFRLERYKLIVEERTDISWQTYEGLNKIIGGSCVTESGIIFIGSKTCDLNENQSKREWFRRLSLLPQWDKTFAWGRRTVLRNCLPEKERKKSVSFIKPEKINVCIGTDAPFSKSREHKSEKTSETLPPNSERSKISWHQSPKWKEWRDHLSLVLTVGLFAGLQISLFVIKNIAYLFRKIKEYFSKH